MKNLLSSTKVILTPITPIHIGNGEEVLPYEYVVKENYLYKINMMDIYNELNQTQQIEFMKYVEEDIIELRNFLSNIYNESFGYEAKIDICDTFKNLYNNKIGRVSNKNEQNSLSINEFVNNFNRAYIPGSSLKGAIRSAFLYDLGQSIFDYRVEKNNKGRIDAKKSDSRKSGEYENSILNKSNPMNDPFKSLKISDSNMVEDALYVSDINIYTYKRRDNEFKKGVPFYSLCTKSRLSTNDNIQFEMNMSIFDGFFFKDNTKLKITKEQIIDALKVKSYDMLERECEFYDNCGYDDTLDVYDELWSIYNTLNEDEVLVRFGKGAGFDSTTFNLVNKQRNNQTDSNSRNLAEGKYPLGWAVIKFV